MKPLPLPFTQAELRKLFNYNPETGLLSWKVSPSNRVKVGSVCGTPDNHGYLRTTLRGKTVKVHRLIWLWVYGDDPLTPIDHINRVKSDNRLGNLRLLTHQQNLENQVGKGYTKTKSGKYQAQITTNGVRVYLGLHECPLLAHLDYLCAKQKKHGSFVLKSQL